MAKIAQRWAEQCEYGHDECRDTIKGWTGQNVGYQGTTDSMNTIKPENIVQAWYDEVKDFDKSKIDRPYDGSSGAGFAKIGHYTQMIWADTKKIGCGAVRFVENKIFFNYNSIHLICNYGPGGNMIGDKIYQSVKSRVNRSTTTIKNDNSNKQNLKSPKKINSSKQNSQSPNSYEFNIPFLGTSYKIMYS